MLPSHREIVRSLSDEVIFEARQVGPAPNAEAATDEGSSIFSIRHPEQPEQGDLATNVALSLEAPESMATADDKTDDKTDNLTKEDES